MTENEQSINEFTYVYGFRSRKYYKLFITENGICGAVIAGTIPDAIMADIMLPRNPAGFFLEPVYNKKILKRHDREDELTPTLIDNLDFLKIDKKNFFWAKEDIQEVRIQTKMHNFTWPAQNSGTITFVLPKKKKKTFIMYPVQDVEHLTENLKKISSNVNVI
ncbi:hypothetical protein [Alkalihalobacterium chitinilyticum]|uniref:Uncharacterized protein n=1 Tax=Alkalihalobacterium chitinilyticum TaxID=2980103 RepID=A0ABT5VHA7_9BACI|nr:hypothetical protein [Alkalihalobacterium chitinilyticum]MDE5414831.1 hypothetical protein [Alkalihalobacterium chitinilyticum]